jgi:hypothetical protein
MDGPSSKGNISNLEASLGYSWLPNLIRWITIRAALPSASKLTKPLQVPAISNN